MNDLFQTSQMSFFKAEKYEYKKQYVFDVSNCPRPHYCMGLILAGEAEFSDCIENRTVTVRKGDIIFVPITSRYISKWKGNPDIVYASMHFIFDFPGVFYQDKNYSLQRVVVTDFDFLKSEFEYVVNNLGDDEKKLFVLSRFYNILGTILPQLETKASKDIDLRLKNAIVYIEGNYNGKISIESLADACHMSVSRFFPAFKKQFAMTPMEYINHYRIHRASVLLVADKENSIENISESVGYSSPEYFRRIFKRITGKTPREYRKSPLKI